MAGGASLAFAVPSHLFGVSLLLRHLDRVDRVVERHLGLVRIEHFPVPSTDRVDLGNFFGPANPGLRFGDVRDFVTQLFARMERIAKESTSRRRPSWSRPPVTGR